MLAERLERIHERVQGLKVGEVPSLPLLERLRALVREDDGEVLLEPVHALHRELERVGVHTSADARLLRELGQVKGRLGELSRGLLLRAEEALAAMEASLREAERLAARGKLSPALVGRLETSFGELARIVKVAAIFSAPEAAPFELLE
jgi:hypothetical protein